MGETNFNSILPSYINFIRYFGWTSRGTDNFQKPVFKNQKFEPRSSSLRLHKSLNGSEELYLFNSAETLTSQVSDISLEESLGSVKRFISEAEGSVISLDTDCNTTTRENIIGNCTTVAPLTELHGITLHPLFRNIVHFKNENKNEFFVPGPIITELSDSQEVSEATKCEDISVCTEEIMPNPFRRNSSAPPIAPPAPPQQAEVPELTRQMGQVWIKFAESLPTSLRNQTTLNISITVGFTLIAWLFLSWLTQLIVSFLCVSVAVFFLSAILSPQTNSWFIANFLLTHMSNLRHSLSDLFLKLGEWLRPTTTQPEPIYNQNQRQIQNQNQSLNQNRRLFQK